MENLLIYVISDSLGETARQVAKAAVSQFDDHEKCDLKRFPFVNTEELLQEILDEAKEQNAMVVYTLVDEKLCEFSKYYCKKEEIKSVDLLTNLLEAISEKTNLKPMGEAGRIRKLDKAYFKRVEAIEFAVKYDDGKDPRGILKADLVLVGISRTSKTPLSMYLANKHIKVANVPLVPEIPVPKELKEINQKKIIGLTNSPEKLNEIRTERLKAMGLSSTANYAKFDRILEELDYSENVMKRLGCPVINVANKAIEETAGVIMDILTANGSNIENYSI